MSCEINELFTGLQGFAPILEELGPVEAHEKLLKQYKSVFHPRHALVLQLKHSLAQLYGRVEGYTLDDLPDILHERKMDLCRDNLKALDVVAPGMSRVRGEA